MKTILEIQNLKCGGCESTIRSSLGSIAFLNNLDINVENGTVGFAALTPEDTERVIRKLSELGYPLNNEKNSLGKRTKSYVSCALGRFKK